MKIYLSALVIVLIIFLAANTVLIGSTEAFKNVDDLYGGISSAAHTEEPVPSTVSGGTSSTASFDRLKIPLLKQDEDSYDCEAVSVAMLLSLKSPGITVETIKEEMPYHDSDPNKGFVASGIMFTVFPPALLPMVEKFAGSAVDLTGCDLADLKVQIAYGKPAAVWLGEMEYEKVTFGTHCVCVVGYSMNGIYFNDPYTGTERFFTNSEFNEHWEKNGFMALTYG